MDTASAREKQIRTRLWLLLSLGGPIGFIGASPYLLPLLEQAHGQAVAKGLAAQPPRDAPSLAVAIAAQLVQLSLLVMFASWAGSRLAPKTGLDAPFLRAWLEKRTPARSFASGVPLALLLGGIFSALILAINLLVSPYLPEVLRQPVLPALSIGGKLIELGKGASSAFYGGIVEELLLRWGLLAAFAALFKKLGANPLATFWCANASSALVFGAGHLPAVAMLGAALTPLVIGYVVLANALAGLVCGWLFWRRGLETAMVAHAAGDVCLHALPLLFASSAGQI
jgi:membrane protease YdiL (CAAX protease family)